MSHLLLDETPLVVLPTLAKIVGINEAIAIQQIHWVCKVKAEHEDYRTFHDDEMWCSYKLDQWLQKMPWLKDRTCRRMLSGLEERKILIVTKPHAKNWNHTKWYRIDYAVLDKLTRSENQICQNDVDKLTRSDRTNLPDLDVDKLTDSSIDKKDIKKISKERGETGKVVKGNFGGDRQNPKASLEQKKETSDSHQKPSTGSNASAARGVRLTAKGGEPQDIVRGLIAELSGDRYEEFIKCAGDYLASTAYWKEQLALGRKITERVILQRYAKDLKFYTTDDDEAIAQKIAPVSTAIQTDVEMYGLDTAIALVPSVTEITTNNLEEACRAYQNAPEILELNREEFQERYGVSQSKFTTYLFENRLI